jgi:hypothetical protein
MEMRETMPKIYGFDGFILPKTLRAIFYLFSAGPNGHFSTGGEKCARGANVAGYFAGSL